MNNQDMLSDVLERAEQALLTIQKQELAPVELSKAREIQRMYEACKDDLLVKLFDLVATSPAKNESDRELAHWQGMIDAYVGLLVRYYTAKEIVEKQEIE